MRDVLQQQELGTMQADLQEQDGFLVMEKVDTFTEKALLEGAGEVLNSAMTNPMFGVL